MNLAFRKVLQVLAILALTPGLAQATVTIENRSPACWNLLPTRGACKARFREGEAPSREFQLRNGAPLISLPAHATLSIELVEDPGTGLEVRFELLDCHWRNPHAFGLVCRAQAGQTSLAPAAAPGPDPGGLPGQGAGDHYQILLAQYDGAEPDPAADADEPPPRQRAGEPESDLRTLHEQITRYHAEAPKAEPEAAGASAPSAEPRGPGTSPSGAAASGRKRPLEPPAAAGASRPEAPDAKRHEAGASPQAAPAAAAAAESPSPHSEP